MSKNKKSELLLPVGNMNMCLAAIHNGADAIYVGMPHFNARGRTTDFSVSELKEMIELCHLYGVRVNLAFNVVIFQDELPEVIKLLKEVLPLRPDALIVQDVGLAKLVRDMAPDQVIHGSTQMTVTNHEAMSLLDDLKIKRFVLGREVSLPEMRAIKEKTDKELEVFVHGALCVAYSGQCFTSESIGGRSANRGQCAQSCRLEYEMIVDGKKYELGDYKYLVSPKDLCGIAEIPELVSIGIESFKVEGRLKTPEYVASAAHNYREAIDLVEAYGKQLSKKEIETKKTEMSLTYSRGFFSGWLHGVNHQDLVDGTYGAHRGLAIGKVKKIDPKSVTVDISYPHLKNGDGVLLAGSLRGKKTEVGGKLYGVKKLKENLFELSFDKSFDFKKVALDFIVYFNSDAVVEKKLTMSYTDKNLKKRIPIHLSVDAEIGKPLKVEASDGERSVTVFSEGALEEASSKPVGRADLEAELGALGNSCFILDGLTLSKDKDFFIHQKELKQIRRQFTELLMQKRIERAPLEMREVDLHSSKKSEKKTPKLNVLLREISQVHDLLVFYEKVIDSLGVVYLDYEFGKGYAESVALLKAKGIKVGIATTRILKPNEYYNFKIIERANPDVILCRNLGAVYYFQDKNFVLKGDFSLNVTNSVTAEYFLGKKLSSVCASYDLNSQQLFDMVKNTDGIEVTTHQYMPSFHMEHCVFAAFLSDGKSFRDCGKPCEEHRLELKDQFGNHHQIKADQECRNTMFNAVPQSAAKLIPELLEKGVSEFRFEALYERGEELSKKILGYANLLTNQNVELTKEIIGHIGVLEKYGLSDGSHREAEYKDRKKG
ncbi:U32 family peptidase [Bacteriovorax stolpii]|uniref:U32 family peptidase n=1 Tax=Bacteriovorax stolpii TaxID=960 RepID=UPI001AAC4909|nr:U32 family peptidase [Bacteriovorax stolpii]